MPEGPEIHRAADRLGRVLGGQPVQSLYFAFPQLKPFEARLRKQTVLTVQARGKAILTRFSNGDTLYSHNQLYGRWEIIEGHDYPESTRSLRVAIHTTDHAALLYSASEIAVLNGTQLVQHPYLTRLGPDLLAPETDIETVLARLTERAWQRRGLIGLLQDQQVLAGIGNYLCCEILHVSGLHPRHRLADLDTAQLESLADNCLRLCRQSWQTGGITNDLSRAEALRRAGDSFEAARFHVYRRAGQACYACGTGIVKQRFGGRMAYLCPACQTLD